MRNEANWKKTFRKLALDVYFPPRIINDLLVIPDRKHNPEIKGKSFFISGEIATGKTILACQLMLEQVKENYLNATKETFYFISFPQMLAEIKATFGNGSVSEYQVMEKYLETDVLLIDDFLTTRPTDWVIDTLYYLINHRYEYLKPTIFTSNKGLPELEDFLGDQRITSRIDRMCLTIEKKPYDRA